MTPTEKYRNEVLKALEERHDLFLKPGSRRIMLAIERCIEIIRALPLPAEPSEPEASCHPCDNGQHVMKVRATGRTTGGVEAFCEVCGKTYRELFKAGNLTSEPPAQAVEESMAICRCMVCDSRKDAFVDETRERLAALELYLPFGPGWQEREEARDILAAKNANQIAALAATVRDMLVALYTTYRDEHEERAWNTADARLLKQGALERDNRLGRKIERGETK